MTDQDQRDARLDPPEGRAIRPRRLARPAPEQYEFAAAPPKLVVDPDEPFIVETEDAFNGMFQSADDLPTAERLAQSADFNPLTGPVGIRGAAPGDTLVVHIDDIVPDDHGISGLTPEWGPRSDSARHPECRGPFMKIIRHLPGPSGTTSDGIGVYSDEIRWSLKPHIGAIGLAPASAVAAGAHASLGNGSFGGNIDVRDVCKGSSLHLPVEQDGGLLYVGDVHASMADAEFAGWGNDARAELMLRCQIVKNKQIPSPRIETADRLIQLHSFKPLERAIEQAFYWLTDWLVSDYGYDPRDAFHQMGVNPDVRIHVYQMCFFGRLNSTVGVSITKEHVGAPAS